MTLNRFASAFVIVLGLLVAACARRETAVEAGLRTGTLEVGNTGEPGELDPHVINAAPDYQVVTAFFEGLLNADPATLAPQPGVAESWTVSADGLTYTFTLRPNARWSNGDPLTAEDFLYSFRRALSPALGSQYTVLFNAVRGAAEYAAGRLTDFSAVGFEAPSPHTLVITLAHATPYFPGIIAGNPVWYPVHRATIESHGRIDQRGTGWTRPGHLIGNGPFLLKEWRPNQFIVAEKSPHYWDSARVRLQAIRIHAIDNLDVQERSFRNGQLHLASVSESRAAALLASRSPALRRTPTLTTSFINVNTARPPLNDVRVRRALGLVLDRPQLARRLAPAGRTPAEGIIPGGMPGYTRLTPLGVDPAAARSLLAAAGFPGGAGFPKLEFSSPAGGSLDLVQAIQEIWRSELGVRVELLQRESRTHWGQLHLKQFDLALGGWAADYPDASTYLDLWTSNGGWNFTHWADHGYDAVIAAAAKEFDPAKRLQHLRAAETRLLEEMPVIPLSFDLTLRLVHPSVRDWFESPLSRPDFRGVWLAPP